MTGGRGIMHGTGTGIDVYWLPLGAGGRFVRLNGKAYEALLALRERRSRLDLYHSALVVGFRPAGRLRLFRYEVRCRPDGVVPDVDEAVDSPRRLTGDPGVARRVLDLAPLVPTPVWGRDELRAGDMWNSNSVVAWLVERAGLGARSCLPPAGGRAPGWSAGVVVARRPAPGAQPSS